MIFSFVFAAIVGVLTWLLGLLPTTGCDSISFASLNIGVWGTFLNLPVIVGFFAVMVAFEVAIQGYRVALYAIRLLKL